MIRGVVAYRIQPGAFWFQVCESRDVPHDGELQQRHVGHHDRDAAQVQDGELVIGTMISTAAVTYFNFGARIVSYARQVVMSLAQNFLPLASQSEATGNMDRLRKVFLAGNRFCAFTSFPITATLLILGKSVIEVWVGKKYVATSYAVLVVMIIRPR